MLLMADAAHFPLSSQKSPLWTACVLLLLPAGGGLCDGSATPQAKKRIDIQQAHGRHGGRTRDRPRPSVRTTRSIRHGVSVLLLCAGGPPPPFLTCTFSLPQLAIFSTSLQKIKSPRGLRARSRFVEMQCWNQ